MAKVTMLNMAGAEAGSIELKDEIFGITPNENAVLRLWRRTAFFNGNLSLQPSAPSV